jgi:uncharacterized membrane protein
MEKETARVARRWPLAAFLGVCLAGLGVAIYLTVLHAQVHLDPNHQSFCAISEKVNCDTVAESEYSIFLGLPNAVWGIVGYALMTLLALWGLTRWRLSPSWPAGLLLALSTFSVGVSIVLAVVGELVIRSLCIMCAASWAASLGLFVLALAKAWPVGPVSSLRQDLAALASRPKLFAGLVLAGAAALAALWLAYPRYWELKGPIGPGGLAFGKDEQGLPWIGAKEPRLTVVEFSDYQCPHCAKAHREMRLALERFKDLRLVHRNYPLDMACNPSIKRPFHEAACERARVAVCAGEQDKFWEMSDYLFLGQRRHNLSGLALAERIGLDLNRFRACLADARTAAHVSRDLAEGRRVGVWGTPWFQVGNAQFAGHVPPERLAFALCAGEQGKLAEASEAVFGLKGEFDRDTLARSVGLDLEKLRRCVEAQPELPRGK